MPVADLCPSCCVLPRLCVLWLSSKVDASKVIAEVSGKHDLKHVAAPKGGLSEADKAAYLAEKQGKK